MAQRSPDLEALLKQVQVLQEQHSLNEAIIRDLCAQDVQQAAKIEHLQTALHTARRIGAAIGILMCTHKVTEDDAFGLLRTVSQRGHRKLRDVADEVVLTGSLPDA